MYGDISGRAAAELLEPKTADFFAKLIQRVSPKSYAQAMAEVTVTGRFLQNFAGDSVCRLTCGAWMHSSNNTLVVQSSKLAYHKMSV